MGAKRKRKLQAARQPPSQSAPALTSVGLDAEDVLATDLRQGEFDTGGADSNALVLPAAKSTTHRESEKPNAPLKLSKKAARKLRKLQEEGERRKLRAEAYSLLSTHSLTQEQQQLLKPSSRRGQEDTVKEKLRHALKLERAGVPVPNTLLTRKRTSSPDRDETAQNDRAPSTEVDIQCTADTQQVSSPPNKLLAIGAPSNGQTGNGLGHQERAAKKQKSETDINVPASTVRMVKCAQDQSERLAVAVNPSAQVEAQVTPQRKRWRQNRKKKAAAAGSEAYVAPVVKHEQEEDHMEVQVAPAANVAPVQRVKQEDTAQVARPAQGPAVRKPVYVKHVQRPAEIEEARAGLPIIAQEQEIMETVNDNPISIICGETGSGKTTQVPQFLYEAGYGSRDCEAHPGIVGVTQPRRVAVLATARRVAHELGLHLGKEVGFQVRHDRRLGPDANLLLRRYSVIIIDEAHERSLNTDILIGLLSRIVPLRQTLYKEQLAKCSPGRIPEIRPLRLVIMSATLRVEDFVQNQRLCPIPPPVLRIPARQYPVTVHFNRRTELHDYIGAAFKKVSQIHQKLPDGGVLVFVTGQHEVESLCRRLRRAFPYGNNRKGAANVAEDKTVVDAETLVAADGDEDVYDRQNHFDLDRGDEDDDEAAYGTDNEDAIDDDATVSTDDDEVKDATENAKPTETLHVEDMAKKGTDKEPGSLHVLPLYALLPAAKQLQVFAPSPANARLIVVATNVAETSITIPGIRYVVDTGRAKQLNCDQRTGMTTFKVDWISKASADQRAGRAGRTGPGHCYRLYSSAHYTNNFAPFAPPEVERIAIDSVVLQMKAMGIEKVVNFPFPTPPERSALAAAESTLQALGALSAAASMLTPLGKSMAAFPVSPRHARLLLAATEGAEVGSAQHLELLSLAVGVAAALSVENPFLRDIQVKPKTKALGEGNDEEANGTEKEKEEAKKQSDRARQAHNKFMNHNSDALSVLNALRAYEAAGATTEFCQRNFLHAKTMHEMHMLRQQLARIAVQQFASTSSATASAQEALCSIPVPKRAQEAVLQRAICAGWVDRVAKRLRVHERRTDDVEHRRAVRYLSVASADTVYLHPSSALAKACPEFVAYNELVQTSRPYMKTVTSVSPNSLSHLAPTLCSFSQPLPEPSAWYDGASDEVKCWVSVTFGRHNWELPLHAITHPDAAQRTTIFAVALLSGSVLPSIQHIAQHYALQPNAMLQAAAATQPRVAELLHALEKAPRVAGVVALSQRWTADRRFLFPQLAAWLKPNQRAGLTAVWPKLLEEAAARAAELARTC
eukprot:jgi/Chlat1/127/Chrsp1S03220